MSRNDGSHVFAKTLDEHNRNVQQYQVKYFRDLKAAKASGQEGQDSLEGQEAQDGKQAGGTAKEKTSRKPGNGKAAKPRRKSR